MEWAAALVLLAVIFFAAEKSGDDSTYICIGACTQVTSDPVPPSPEPMREQEPLILPTRSEPDH